MAKVSVTGAPVGMGSVISRATAALNGYSPAAMQQSAQKLSAGILAPQIAAQNASNQAQQQLLSNLYNRQTGFSLALAKLSDPNAQTAMQPYLAGAGALANLGQGITGQAGQDWQNAATQASQTAAGLTGGQGSVQGAYSPSSMQSVGYQTGFALPGASLADQAVSAAADARNRSIESANQLGVIAANTQQQQAMANTENARQLAAIRAQAPGIVQQSLQTQQGLRQNAFDTLAGLAQNQAQMAQSAQQFGVTSGEQRRADIANETINRMNAATQAGYLGQAGQLLGGKKTAQDITNRANLQQLTGRIVDANGKVTNQLAPGWISLNGQAIPYSSYVQGLQAQSGILANKARQALYESRMNPSAASTAAASTAKNSLVKFASSTLQDAIHPAPYTSYSVDANGKSVKQTTSGTVVPYNQALAQITALGQGVPGWENQAKAMVDAAYKPGTHGRPLSPAQVAAAGQKKISQATQAADDSYKQGIPYGTALANAKKQKVVPFAVARYALYNRYFSGALSPIPSQTNTIFGGGG